MGLVQDMKEDLLYERANKEGIPFFLWFKWLETTLNREVLKVVF
jgi:hypothetical protein